MRNRIALSVIMLVLVLACAPGAVSPPATPTLFLLPTLAAPTPTWTPEPTTMQEIEETQVPNLTESPPVSAIILSPLENMQTNSKQVLSLAWLADNSRFAVGTSRAEEHNLLVGNPMTGEWPLQITTSADRISSVAWSPDGSTLAAAGSVASGSNLVYAESGGNHTFNLLDVETGDFTMAVEGSSVTSIAWSPDGKMIALGTEDGDIVLLESEETEGDDEPLPPLDGGNRPVDSVAWSPDGTKLAMVISKDVLLWSWDGASFKRLLVIQDAGDSVTWSPDGGMLATTGNRCGIWHTETGELLLRLNGITSLSWSPDSSMIVTDAGRNIAVLDARTGSVLVTTQGHNRSVSAVAWSPDGMMIVSGDEEGVVMVWGIRKE
ncbi:MAG: PD40 domain-containing protein [Anaerolineae bacterium]|nr:PD40 domain-containing protein [Anaerolineae bacterium]